MTTAPLSSLTHSRRETDDGEWSTRMNSDKIPKRELENMDKHRKLAEIKVWAVQAQQHEKCVDWQLLQPYRDWLIDQLKDQSAKFDYKRAVVAALGMIEKLYVPTSVVVKAAVEKKQNGDRTNKFLADGFENG